MKILASDFDGTICFRVNDEHCYRDEDIKAISEFQKKGNKFGLNTGRSLLTLDNVHPKTDGVIPFDFFVVDSGALVADQNKTPIFEDWIDSKAARKAMNIGNIENVFFSTEDGYVSFKNTLPQLPCRILDSESDLNDLHIRSMCLEPDDLKIAAMIAQRISEAGLPLTVQQNWTSVDISPEGCSKGTALERIADHYKVELKDVAAIGDGLNDLSAIKAAGISFAMENAPEQLKAAADYTVDSVAKAIEILEELEKN